MLARTLLFQNYHPMASQAIIRDFKRIGFRVFSPDTDWGSISYFADNNGLGSEVVSREEYFAQPPGYAMIGCKAHEEDIKSLARQHGDTLILNIAQQHHTYEPGISDVLLSGDVDLYERYPGPIAHRLLYLIRPYLEEAPVKDLEASFEGKLIRSYINCPELWSEGTEALRRFQALYPFDHTMFGTGTDGGLLSHRQCSAEMAASFFTVHFKELEAYGLSCIESMMIGTPVVSTNRFVDGKTLGRYFLTPENSIVEDTIERGVERLLSLSLEEYRAMSAAATARVLDLTSDANTVRKLAAIFPET